MWDLWASAEGRLDDPRRRCKGAFLTPLAPAPVLVAALMPSRAGLFGTPSVCPSADQEGATRLRAVQLMLVNEETRSLPTMRDTPAHLFSGLVDALPALKRPSCQGLRGILQAICKRGGGSAATPRVLGL